jgi:hypothetical protein
MASVARNVATRSPSVNRYGTSGSGQACELHALDVELFRAVSSAISGELSVDFRKQTH